MPGPAPQVDSFGDGSHAPGASGITIAGAGFGPLAGSAWIYQNDDLTGSADELTVMSWADLEIVVDIPGSLTNTAGTRYLFLQRSDLAWSNAFAFTLEAASGVTLTVQNASHGHAAQSPALTQANTLAVQNAAHGHAADSVALTQANTLAVQNAGHGHTAESVSLTQANTLAVQGASHGHAADNVDLASGLVLSVASAAHGHTAESPTLTQANVLAVADASHGHTAESPDLIQGNALSVASAQHAHTASLVTLRLPGNKVPPSARVFVVPRRHKIAA